MKGGIIYQRVKEEAPTRPTRWRWTTQAPNASAGPRRARSASDGAVPSPLRAWVGPSRRWRSGLVWARCPRFLCRARAKFPGKMSEIVVDAVRVVARAGHGLDCRHLTRP